MSILGAMFGRNGGDPEERAAAAARRSAWGDALADGVLPEFVERRLTEAAAGRIPWLSTMTPAELLLSRSHGIRPIATVSGTCWYHYGYSWTQGHTEGWHAALERLKLEALAAGANAVVDVKLRTLKSPAEHSMDFTVFGTAVKIDGLPPSTDPVIVTAPAIEFVRLLEEGIVPTGVAIGAHCEWFDPYVWNAAPPSRWDCRPLPELGDFWRRIRQQAVRNLRSDTRSLGDGVLAHTHFGELLKIETKDDANSGPRYFGRFIIVGTTVQCKRRDNVLAPIRTVVDMRDDLSPLNDPRPHGHSAYPIDSDREGAI